MRYIVYISGMLFNFFCFPNPLNLVSFGFCAGILAAQIVADYFRG